MQGGREEWRDVGREKERGREGGGRQGGVKRVREVWREHGRVT